MASRFNPNRLTFWWCVAYVVFLIVGAVLYIWLDHFGFGPWLIPLAYMVVAFGYLIVRGYLPRKRRSDVDNIIEIGDPADQLRRHRSAKLAQKPGDYRE